MANAAGALPEVVGDGGVLVNATDPYALADAVAQVLRDEGVRQRLAQAARGRLAALDLASAGDRAVDVVLSRCDLLPAASPCCSGAHGLLGPAPRSVRVMPARSNESARDCPAAVSTWRSVASRRTRRHGGGEEDSGDLSGSTSPAPPTVSGTAVMP